MTCNVALVVPALEGTAMERREVNRSSHRTGPLPDCPVASMTLSTILVATCSIPL